MIQKTAIALILIRLLPEIDDQLRRHYRRRGDLVKLLETILTEVDLGKIPVAPLSFEKGVQSTSIKVPAEERDRLKRYAASRGVSVNALINAAIQAHLSSTSSTRKVAKLVR